MPVPNWIPYELGGDPSMYDAVYRAMREAVGTLAGPEEGLEDAWRTHKAAALVDAASLVELAVMQALPAYSTVHIPVYEQNLRLSPGPEDDDVTRRQRIVEVGTAQIGADYPALRASIKRIDPNADVDAIPEEYSTTTRFGKIYGATGGTEFPAFSTRFVVTVRYILGPGQVAIPEDIRTRVADLLNTSLPTWVDWYLHVGEGFFTDGGLDGQSLLNSKLLGP